MSMIHQLSCVHPDAQIGENVIIEPFVNIAKDVIIGDGTHVMSNAVIMEGARIGKNCMIFPCAVISGHPQDLKFDGEYTIVEIGDNTIIRECVTINRGTKAKNKTVIGNNCMIMACAHIAHDVQVGNNCVIVSHTGIAGEVEIGDWAILSGGTMIHQFVRIGTHAMIAGASVEQLTALDEYGKNFGLAFQITDDLLDVLGDEEKVGKRLRKDVEMEKWSYPHFLGIEGAKRAAEHAVSDAENALSIFECDALPLQALLEMVRTLPNRIK